MNIMPFVRMLRRGSLTPHCLDQYTNNEVYLAALRVVHPLLGGFIASYATEDECEAQSAHIDTLRIAARTYPPQLRKQVFGWLNYYKIGVNIARKRLRYTVKNGVVQTQDQRIDNVLKCAGVKT